MTKNPTKIKKIKISKFRGLNNIDINIADRITLISGKNGTSKSTILGIIAQVFSFTKDYTTDTELNFKTLAGKNFKSSFSEHFRFSSTFDKPGEMKIEIEVYDAYENKIIDTLSLDLVNSTDRDKARPVVRGNIPTKGSSNTSRNITHPVIYLSLKRLMPISERLKYEYTDIEYLKKNAEFFKQLSNQLLNKSSSSIVSATKGTIDAAVVHGKNYDIESVSAGEDNTGQILQALFSFKRLKEEYTDYHGGILLIDEADAGLFPSAQKELIKILTKLSKELSLQIIMTSHSPIMIESIYNLSLNAKKDYKNLFLTDTFGSIELKENYSWLQINADLFIDTIKINSDISLPKVNIYFEDQEALDFYSALITDRKINKITRKMKNIKLGCKEYLRLVSLAVPEFSKLSLVILDGDQKEQDIIKFKNIIKLPFDLPPDQLVFDFLFKLPADDKYWANKIQYSRPVFIKDATKVLIALSLDNDTDQDFNLKKAISKYKGTKPIREIFKEFYNSENLQDAIQRVDSNPFRAIIERDPQIKTRFLESVKKSLSHVLISGYFLDKSKAYKYLDL